MVHASLSSARNRLAGVVLLHVLICCLTASASRGQQVAGAFGEVVDVRVVNLEVVATDRQGNRVPDLRPEDFRILVDGREVAIEYFTEVRGGVAREEVSAPASVTLPAVRPGQPVGTSYLVFIDDFFSPPLRRDDVLEGLRDHLARLGPQDRMAIVAYNGRQIEMLSTWSGSVEALTRVLEAARERPSFSLMRQAEEHGFQSIDSALFGVDGTSNRVNPVGVGNMNDTSLTIEERQFASLVRSQVQRVVAASTAALRSFARPPGRKVMLVVSGGWPMSPEMWVTGDLRRSTFSAGPDTNEALYRPLVETANRLSYTLYPVYVPSYRGPGASDADLTSSSQGVVVDAQGENVEEVYENTLEKEREITSRNALQYLAVETGGEAYFGGATVTALERTVEDTRSYYWIGFTPTWKGDDESHKIVVKPARKGFETRGRRSFSDLSRETEVSMMVESSLLFDTSSAVAQLPVRLGVGRPAGRGKQILPVQVAVPLAALTFLPDQGKLRAEAEIRIAVRDEEGVVSDIPAAPMSFKGDRLPGKDDFKLYETEVKIRDRTSELIVSVYDKLSGTILMSKVPFGERPE